MSASGFTKLSLVLASLVLVLARPSLGQKPGKRQAADESPQNRPIPQSGSVIDYSGELPRIAPTDATRTGEQFTIADGFKLELVASEPLVASPVAIEWDADGAMYVCEMRGYSENRDDGLSRVRRLVDTDEDGRYDRSEVFLDGLLWPTAILPYDGGLFIGDAPDILYCKDTNGDGHADAVKTVLTGFGTSNVQGLMNSFRWGLDNRIHVACSSAGGKVHRPGRPQEALNVRGRDLAFDPRTFEFELTSGGGQHGMCFDDWGNKYASSNSDHIQEMMYEDHYIARNRSFSARPARVSIASDGPQAEVFRTSRVEPWRIVRTRLRVGGVVPGPIEGGGRASGYFTGATGVTIYRGDSWPKMWRGLAFIGDVGGNLIHRKRLRQSGVQHVADRIDSHSEFVCSSDVWFRPAQFANGPDGNLHVIDVYREVIEHPKSLPPQIKQHLDLTAGRDRGRIFRIAAIDATTRPTPRLSAKDSTELLQLLEHANAWHRETAARLLFERQDQSIIPALRKLALTSSEPLGRLHAMYVLKGMDRLDAEVVARVLSDEHPQLRTHAIRLLEEQPDPSQFNDSVTRLSSDDSINVRYQLAFTLGSLDHPKKPALLARILKRDASSSWVRTAVQSSLSEGAGTLFELLLSDPSFRTDGASEFLGSLAQQIGRQRKSGELAAAASTLLNRFDNEPAFALPIANQLLMANNVKANAKHDASSEAKQLVESIVVSASQMASDETLSSGVRKEAIRALPLGPWDRVGDQLLATIDTDNSEVMRLAAIDATGKFVKSDVAMELIERWNQFGPSLRRAATEILFARPNRAALLFKAVQDGKVPLEDLPRERISLMATSSDPTLKTKAQAFLDATAPVARADVIAKYRNALGNKASSISRGRDLFRKHCAACHRVEETGHEIGPSLAAIKSRGSDAILVNVMDPNAEVNPQYLNYAVLTLDGRTVTGMIASENATSVTLRRAEGVMETVLRSDIERLQSTRKSIMPEGFEKSITPSEMADLVSYLMGVN